MPNHWGFEKWKKTIFRAAKQRKPVKASNRAGLRISTNDWTSPRTHSNTSPQARAGARSLTAGTGMILRRYQRSHFFTEYHAADIARLIHVEDDHGRLLSLHRLTAVRYITFRPCFRISI